MQTALTLEVPELDAVVDEHRKLLDPARGRGMMAHITVLYPFIHTGDLTDAALDALTSIATETPPFDAMFGEVRWFGSDIAWLAPTPEEPFVALTRRIVERFPSYQPYGGAFGDIIPHATIGHRGTQQSGLDAAVRQVERQLPVSASVRRLSLLVREPSTDQWELLRRFALGVTP
jgi:2'-5' RNA ligase